MAQSKRSGLGRGLDSVFTDNNTLARDPGELKINKIYPRRNQPRKNFDAEGLEELASSIASHGLIQPICVRSVGADTYEIIAGERRWRAAKLAGLESVPVRIIDSDEKTSAELALIENVQREDLSPLEEASAYRSLMEEYGLTQEALSKSVGKSRSAIANQVRLLDLPPETMKALDEGRISVGHAKVLLGAGQAADILLQKVIDGRMSVRQTEETVRKYLLDSDRKEEAEPDRSDEIIKIDYRKLLSDKVSNRLGRRAVLRGKGKSRRIEIYYDDEDDLEALITSICGDDFFDE